MGIREDRQNILNYCKYSNWTVLTRKINENPSLKFSFNSAQQDVPLSLQFLHTYGHNLVNWHSIYWNENIPLKIKEHFKERIFWYWVNNCFDFRAPYDWRVESLTAFFDKYFGLSYKEFKQKEETNAKTNLS